MTWLHGRGRAQRNVASWDHALIVQLVSDARHLTVDLSGLAFADSDSIQAWCWRPAPSKSGAGT